MRRSRTGVSDQYGIRARRQDCPNNVGNWKRPKFSIKQLNLMAIIYQRTGNAQQAKRWQMIIRNSTANCSVWRIDDEQSHLVAVGKNSKMLGG